MSLIFKIANKIARNTPYFISHFFVNIPFKFRFGKDYSEFENKIKESEKWGEKELENYIISNFNIIFQHAKKIKLYRDKYEESGIINLVVKNLEDIKKVPILTKDEIRENISQFKGYYKQNTGGTTGRSLPLYLDKNYGAREWAHYHYIWNNVGYSFTDTKFVFRGVNFKNKFIKYNHHHNEFHINAYQKPSNYIDEFFKILTSRNVKYFHGYPSLINDFLKGLEKNITQSQKEIIQNQIKCCLYSSEYPTPQIVDYLKKVWNLDFLSCYGHSEICVLAAAKKNELDYFPFHTYGYAEVEDNMLLGTSYHNIDMPLIRYNTGDLVSPKKYTNGLLKSFQVREGRVGDFILDKNNKRISLTALFFGRHHKIFNYANYIQVFQKEKGDAIIIVSQNQNVNLDAPSLMDLQNVEIDFNFLYLNKPIRTKSGKVPLKVLKLP